MGAVKQENLSEEPTFEEVPPFMHDYPVHGDQNPNRVHHCNLCGRSFTRSSHLKRHISIHQDEKPFKCDYCDQRFTRQEHKTRHSFRHTNHRPHQCDYCSKQFARSDHLSNHTKTHTGEKPYSCLLCEKTFSRADHRNIHVRRHNNGILGAQMEASKSIKGMRLNAKDRCQML